LSVFDACKVCGVPSGVGKDLEWHPDGTLTQRHDDSNRVLFYECRGMDELFGNIEKTIGASIFKQVVESKSRSAIKYVKGQRFGPPGGLALPVLRHIHTVKKLVAGTRFEGYGRIEVTELDWRKVTLECEVLDPYSLPMVCGDIRGSFEAVRGKPVEMNCVKTGDGRYRVSCFMSPHAPELEDRLAQCYTEARPGDFRHNLCPGCGVPLEVSQFRWDVENGTIRHPELDLRMAFFSADSLRAVFDELCDELGDSIRAAIIEAVRRRLLSLMTPRWKILGPDDAQRWLAIEGMGNVVSMEQTGRGFSVFVQNPGVPLLIAGDSLAVFEYSTGQPGSVEWALTGEGDLSMEVYPA
jgi:hypothetical protein